MLKDDIYQFEEMIAKCYSILVGTKRTIEIAKKAFDLVDTTSSPNIIFYEIKSEAKTESKLMVVTDIELKIEILKELRIL